MRSSLGHNPLEHSEWRVVLRWTRAGASYSRHAGLDRVNAGVLRRHAGRHQAGCKPAPSDGALHAPTRRTCPFPHHHVLQGVRFNAEKKQVGQYHSTRIWSFRMRTPCCQHTIEIHTDPKNAEYVIVSGARR